MSLTGETTDQPTIELPDYDHDGIVRMVPNLIEKAVKFKRRASEENSKARDLADVRRKMYEREVPIPDDFPKPTSYILSEVIPYDNEVHRLVGILDEFARRNDGVSWLQHVELVAERPIPLVVAS